jgi:hypothetical protein
MIQIVIVYAIFAFIFCNFFLMLLHFGVAKGTKDCYATRKGEFPWMYTNQTDIDARLEINAYLKVFES